MSVLNSSEVLLHVDGALSKARQWFKELGVTHAGNTARDAVKRFGKNVMDGKPGVSTGLRAAGGFGGKGAIMAPALGAAAGAGYSYLDDDKNMGRDAALGAAAGYLGLMGYRGTRGPGGGATRIVRDEARAASSKVGNMYRGAVTRARMSSMAQRQGAITNPSRLLPGLRAGQVPIVSG